MRRHLPLFWSVVAGALILGTGPRTGAAPPVARITLTSKTVMYVELLNRTSAGLVTMRETGRTSELQMAPSDLASVEFQLNLEKTDFDNQYAQEQYKEAAATLGAVLQPLFPFIDLPENNALPAMMLMIKCLYWDGQYAQAGAACDLLLGKTGIQPYDTRAKVFKALILIEQTQPDRAADLLTDLTAPLPTDEEAGLFYFALGRIRLAQNRIPEAQECAAKIVAFQSRDFDWMPPGLYLSAEGYGRAKKYDVANQIAEEIKTLYPESRWAKSVATLQEELEKRRQKEEEEARKADSESTTETKDTESKKSP